MRILHVLDHSLPLHSGYSFRTISILREQRVLGWETHQLTTPRHGSSTEETESVEGWIFRHTPLTALRGQAARLEISQRVVFAGRVPHSDVRRYYDLIDVLVYPRRSIRLTEIVTPLKPLEAMVQGRMFIASDVGGHRELIRDRDTGCLFPAGNAAALARAIESMLASRPRWKDSNAAPGSSVPDVRPYAQRAALTVAPLRIARGTQNKILEAMAMGIPVVCSDVAAGGVDAVPGEHLLTSATPPEIARAVLRILDSPAERAPGAGGSRPGTVASCVGQLNAAAG